MIRDTEFFPEIDSRLKIMDLGMSSYETVWGLQKELQARRISGEIGDHLLLVEHEPVYTLGKISHKAHLLRSNDHGISVIQTDRGGDITFHGPGQLVGYPILDLHRYRRSVSWYMRSLEKIINVFSAKSVCASALRSKPIS